MSLRLSGVTFMDYDDQYLVRDKLRGKDLDSNLKTLSISNIKSPSSIQPVLDVLSSKDCVIQKLAIFSQPKPWSWDIEVICEITPRSHTSLTEFECLVFDHKLHVWEEELKIDLSILTHLRTIKLLVPPGWSGEWYADIMLRILSTVQKENEVQEIIIGSAPICDRYLVDHKSWEQLDNLLSGPLFSKLQKITFTKFSDAEKELRGARRWRGEYLGRLQENLPKIHERIRDRAAGV
ncbi:hypothetical protein BDQ17DRAFT_1433494 [Cyathus striatus]|nr:hypothetical protein BDQ17DRAFT_1433494 [Cyathus striatus]